MSNASCTALEVDGREVRVYRSQRRTASLQVREAGIVVRCPVRTSDAEIRQWLGRKQRWLQRHLDRQQAQQAARPRLMDGARWHFRGQPLRLSLASGTRWDIHRSRGHLMVTGPDLSTTRLNSRLSDWYRSEAKAHMAPATRCWARQLGLARRLRDVRFRRTRSKWGHCSRNGIIQYNWQVMQAPDFVIEYLMVHEVCHLREPNHGPAFWALVEQHQPQRRTAQTWLREHGGSLNFAD